jgi:hypothetical protein
MIAGISHVLRAIATKKEIFFIFIIFSVLLCDSSLGVHYCYGAWQHLRNPHDVLRTWRCRSAGQRANY